MNLLRTDRIVRHLGAAAVVLAMSGLLRAQVMPDCNGNGIDDTQDLISGTSTDCNRNGTPDDCDIDISDPDGDGHVSGDCQDNGLPDECEMPFFHATIEDLLLPTPEQLAATQQDPVVMTAAPEVPDRFRFPVRETVVNTKPKTVPAPDLKAPGGLTVTPMSTGLTAADLANYLVGDDVEISNPKWRGKPVSAGLFAGGESIIGFETGIILSSGEIKNVIGPNESDGITGSLGLDGDAQLNGLIPGYQTHDATVLEFDFECQSAQVIQFQYVFASDEYNEYVGSSYNDVFGFFLNNQNIAIVPGTSNKAVSINNVNCGTTGAGAGSHCDLYRNNDLQNGGGSINSEMDGLTVVLTATATVQPGLNHMKLAVADAGDSVLDSNVFIKAESFQCGFPAGACCNEITGLCLDSVPEDLCVGEGLVHTQDATCIEVGCLPLAAGEDCNLDWIPDECQGDSDGDGVPDPCDVCGGGDDAIDADNDGVPDDCDNCPTVYNARQGDGDGDGIGACCDNNEPDTDGDGFKDECDTCPQIPDHSQGDVDHDGVGTLCDNCPDHANADQSDFDGDGQGDVCDEDDDNDTIDDEIDNCPLVFNTDQADANEDGLGDACSAQFFHQPLTVGAGGFDIDNSYGAGSGLWHLTTARTDNPGHSPPQSLYYGQEEFPGPGNYDAGRTSGRVLSPVIDLADIEAPIALSFSYFLETEEAPALFDADVASVEVSQDGGAFTRLASNDVNDLTPMLIDGSGLWQRASVDLSRYAGATIQIAFVFDTIDPYANGFEGWFVDDITLAGVAEVPPDCNLNGLPDNEDIAEGRSFDCDGNGTPDECEPDLDMDGVMDACDACPHSKPGAVVREDGCINIVPADLQGDGDVDEVDYLWLEACASGPELATVDPKCSMADLDGDGDVDQDDFGLFQRCLSGTDVVVDPDCMAMEP